MSLPDDPAVLAYVAGLFDGEGCITRSRVGDVWHWQLQVGMTHEPVICWLGTFGGRMRQEARTAKGWRTIYSWRVFRQSDVLVFLRAVLPYLRVKRDRATEAAAYIAGRLEA